MFSRKIELKPKNLTTHQVARLKLSLKLRKPENHTSPDGGSCSVWIRFDNLETESEHEISFLVSKVSNQFETHNLTKPEYELCSLKPSLKPENWRSASFWF